MNRLLYYSFIAIHRLVLLLLWIIHRRLKYKTTSHKIAAFPYYPETWPGGLDRIAAWKPYFETDGNLFHVFGAYTAKQLQDYMLYEKENKEWGKYKILWLIYWSRVRVILELRNYGTIWIQRGFIPIFPFKHGYYEKLLSKIHPNVIYDFYDADYESNYRLVFDTVSFAKKVTVASRFLENKYKTINSNVFFIRYAIDTANFVTLKTTTDRLRIGWMGSPENAVQLTKIADQLKVIEDNFPQVLFSFVCRDMPDLGLKNVEVMKWGDVGFNYNLWLSTVDIGLVPFLSDTDRVKAKISMKSLEFMASGVPIVVSPWVHSDMLNNTNCQIAEHDNWYSRIKEMIVDNEKRTSNGLAGREIFENYHTYPKIYPLLKKVLTENVR